MAGIEINRTKIKDRCAVGSWTAAAERPLPLKEKGDNMSIFGDTLQPQKRELLLPDGSGIKYL